ncbi:COMM domain-containing protein 4 isoform X2 [Sapajus apella]|uniref:COMM domain-containing protein 4 isoform X2 n=2 Tax=Sapajus apella TaxID=9515 RepID=A0A6J3HDA1_SAPAP|nr:COMM domain-containing protein 4 isoform X2 [Sapajus apella]
MPPGAKTGACLELESFQVFPSPKRTSQGRPLPQPFCGTWTGACLESGSLFHTVGKPLCSFQSQKVVVFGLRFIHPSIHPPRFRFCGDLDCPDWVLAEISTLAKMYEKILKLMADTKFESGDVKATVAVLSFILSSAAKHSVDGESLSSELQQLGLPKEHAASLCRCYEEKQIPLQKHLRVCSLRTNRLAGVGWRVDYTLSSSLLQSVEEPMVHLRLEVAAAPGTPAQPVAMSLSADKFQVLLAELKQAQTLMSSLG